MLFRSELAETKKIKQDLEQSLEVKDSLLRELHHRVRNNMQVVQSLLSMEESHGTLELAGRRVGALAMANDLSLTGQEAPLVDVHGLIRSLVYQYTLMTVDRKSAPLVLVEEGDRCIFRCIDPQLAGLLAIITSDILLAISKTKAGSTVRISPGNKCVHVDFRFSHTIDKEQGSLILSSITSNRLIAGAHPDIQIKLLNAETEQGPGLRLIF